MSSFDLSLLSYDEAKELYGLVRKYQESEKPTYEQRGWCASVLDKLFDILASGDTPFPICDEDYTYVIEEAFEYNLQSNLIQN